jgi:hypothetical protein
VTRPAGRPPSPPSDGQVCTLFAVDIAGFTRPDRDDDIRLHLHEELYRILEKALGSSGIPWAGCSREDRGDGVLIVVPPGTACKAIIDPLPERLRGLIRRHNHVSSAAATFQLRAAAHIGPVDHDGNGFIGSDINFLFRMLDSRPLKRALTGSSPELALIVSDYVYRNVVCRYPTLASPDTFQPARFQVKYTRARAWTYLPGTPPPQAARPPQANIPEVVALCRASRSARPLTGRIRMPPGSRRISGAQYPMAAAQRVAAVEIGVALLGGVPGRRWTPPMPTRPKPRFPWLWTASRTRTGGRS